MTWEPRKLAKITKHLWEERKIMGLFLSSSVFKDSDFVTERQLETVRALRNMRYTGYIHLRLMPDIDRHYIREAIELADRVGVNLEAPNKEVFSELCPDKGGFEESVRKRLEWIVDEVRRAKAAITKPKFGFAKAGVDTQMIVGAVDDNDWQHLQTTEWLYKKLDDEGFLPNVDPKLVLAKMNPDFFPIDLNTASYHEILRIPQIGRMTTKKIMEARKNVKIRYVANLEQIIGANLTRRVSQYIELKDKRLANFLKAN